MRYNPHGYQTFSEEHLIQHKAAALFLEMGLGKTVATLTAINRLMFDYLDINRVLVIAPKKVMQSTWTDERDKWDHLRHLRITKIEGTERDRKLALRKKTEIHIISRDNVAWLVTYLGCAWPYDMVVIDELSSFKSPKAIRFRQLRKVIPLSKRVVGLTGTPAPNSLIDLWAQIYLLDGGERLGKNITHFRDTYFTPGKRRGAQVFSYDLKKGTPEQQIYKLIGDICVSMKAEDYLKLPEKISRIVSVNMPAEVAARYKSFEQELIMEMDTGEVINAANAAALCNKLLQFANGSVYDEEKRSHHTHDEKLEALDEIIEAAGGRPVLVFYWYKSDLERLQARFKEYKPRKLNTEQDIKDWNAGKIQVMFAQPQSAGHGLNLQAGGNIIVWFGLTWSLELYQQANARLYRQGQEMAVIIHHLVAKGTIDEDVMMTLERKADGQNALMHAVRAVIARAA